MTGGNIASIGDMLKTDMASKKTSSIKKDQKSKSFKSTLEKSIKKDKKDKNHIKDLDKKDKEVKGKDSKKELDDKEVKDDGSDELAMSLNLLNLNLYKTKEVNLVLEDGNNIGEIDEDIELSLLLNGDKENLEELIDLKDIESDKISIASQETGEKFTDILMDNENNIEDTIKSKKEDKNMENVLEINEDGYIDNKAEIQLESRSNIDELDMERVSIRSGEEIENISNEDIEGLEFKDILVDKSNSEEELDNNIELNNNEFNIRNLDTNNIQDDLKPVEDINSRFRSENIEVVNDSMIKMIETMEDGQTSTMKVQLRPKELGSIDIMLTMEEGEIQAKILVGSENVKDLFQNSLEELSNNLLEQNIFLNEMEIDLSQDNEQGNSEGFSNKDMKRRKNRSLNNSNIGIGKDVIERGKQISDGLSILA